MNPSRSRTDGFLSRFSTLSLVPIIKRLKQLRGSRATLPVPKESDPLEAMTPIAHAVPQLFAAGALYSLPCRVAVLLPSGRVITAPFAFTLRFSDGKWVNNDFDHFEFIGFVPTHWQYAATPLGPN